MSFQSNPAGRLGKTLLRLRTLNLAASGLFTSHSYVGQQPDGCRHSPSLNFLPFTQFWLDGLDREGRRALDCVE